MSRNEYLLIASSYFWSNAITAFLFGLGTMSPTLDDVLLLIGLDMSSSDTLFGCRDLKLSHRLKTKHMGGWSRYISEHMKEGTITDRERMWPF
jgi:hypothetical protein